MVEDQSVSLLIQQLTFAISVLLLSWYGMMAIHELGHVIGTYSTGGTVLRVVLEPLSMSHTEYGQFPHSGIVVWCGPVVGSVLPLALIPAGKLGQFFAGFCLVANGAYIGGGSFEGVGDCGLMLLTGTPVWAMWIFGIASFASGLYLWHRLGAMADFWKWHVSPRFAYSALGLLVVVVSALSALAVF
jgi:hypothetical protein